MVHIVLCVTECAKPPTNPFAKMSRDELRILVASSLSVRDALGRAGAGRGSGGAFQAFNRSIEEHGLKQEYAALARRGPKQATKRTSAVWHPEALVHASAGAESIADVVENLGLSRTASDNLVRVRRSLIAHGLPLPPRARPATPEDIAAAKRALAGGQGRAATKRRLVEAGALENCCQGSGCTVGATWVGKPLVLHLDHINGDPTDDRVENLRLLCPNCHSQTDTYTGRNVKRGPKRPGAQPRSRCMDCGKSIAKKSRRCVTCEKAARTERTRNLYPDLDSILEMVDRLGWVGAGREIGVSDNAVRKHVAREQARVTQSG